MFLFVCVIFNKEIKIFSMNKFFYVWQSRYGGNMSIFKGIEYTSPTLATAISNLTPAFTFIFAVVFRFSPTPQCFFFFILLFRLRYVPLALNVMCPSFEK